MKSQVQKIIVLGGGTAGWLSAGIIAAQHRTEHGEGLSITLIESPEVKILGVGEGTWPTMRDTLRKMGISENEFIRECDVSFKQGTQFQGWVNGDENDIYYHPFGLPQGYFEASPAAYWSAERPPHTFAHSVSAQPTLCEQHRAPKQKDTPEFAAVVNYGYHLDAVKFANFLRKHCTEKLGVRHIVDHVTKIHAHENGDIASLSTPNQTLAADLFIDCSGFAAKLIGEHYQVPFTDLDHVLFNNRAMVVQVPYADAHTEIQSATISTAQSAGWIWDIALPTRRGLGYVYASAYLADSAAEAQLNQYIADTSVGVDVNAITCRKIEFRPGHRTRFWHRNCVAIGTSAGFIEPLEASALVLIELSADFVSQQLPRHRDTMDTIAERFNACFLYRWQRITDFLKLHYVLSQRQDSDYWQQHRQAISIPASLKQLLALWKDAPPSRYDFPLADEVFPAASHQYVLYGMGFETHIHRTAHYQRMLPLAQQQVQKNLELTARYLAHLPSNRALLTHIHQNL